MPSRNIIREYSPDSYYHVYNRGVAKQPVFLDAADKKHFLKIISRHLDPSNTDTRYDSVGYQKYHKDLELLCYCLMGNHFHLLFFMGEDTDALKKFMHSALTAYTMYFNKKYKRIGTLFQGVFKASRITNDAYLMHISRYVHLNPRWYRTYFYSSLAYYTGKKSPAWLHPERITKLFEGDDYLKFLEDHEEYKSILEELKYELADS